MVSKDEEPPTPEQMAIANIARAIAHLANTFEGGITELTFFDDQSETFGKAEIHLTQRLYRVSNHSGNVRVKVIVTA